MSRQKSFKIRNVLVYNTYGTYQQKGFIICVSVLLAIAIWMIVKLFCIFFRFKHTFSSSSLFSMYITWLVNINTREYLPCAVNMPHFTILTIDYLRHCINIVYRPELCTQKKKEKITENIFPEKYLDTWVYNIGYPMPLHVSSEGNKSRASLYPSLTYFPVDSYLW